MALFDNKQVDGTGKITEVHVSVYSDFIYMYNKSFCYPSFCDRLQAYWLFIKLTRDYMSTGVVKFFNEDKGFGFILQDGGGKDLFVHASEIQGDRDTTLNEGQKVEYEIGEGKKGPCAVNVIPL